MSAFHKPVLLKEVIRYLNIKKKEKYIDATVGGGSHSAAICKLGGQVLGIDLDPEAIEAARRHLLQACPARYRMVSGPFSNPKSGNGAPWRLAEGNFIKIDEIARKHGFVEVSGILFDLGVSSHQLDDPSRGFSFRGGPLDMRMSPELGVKAADLLNALGQKELHELFNKLGEEKHSRRLAALVVRARRIKAFKNTDDLVALFPPKRRGERLHPATRVFQALRIAVNDELNNLRAVLPTALALLKTKGRLVVISFHSGEDRIVKNFFENQAGLGKLEVLTKKPLRPSEEEVSRNPRSRSAKLRVAEKK